MRKTPDRKDGLSLLDELNLSRHGLISIQKRISRDWTSWTDTYIDENREISVTCKSTPDYGVPHGLDTDVIIGIQNLFVQQGCPASNRVRGTAYQMLKASGLDTSGRYYTALRESLMRLSHSTYTIQRGWYADGMWLTETFRHFQGVRFISGVRDGLSAESLIEVELSNQIAVSLRNGYLKPLNGDVLRDLGQHSARALFRLLDGVRHDPTRPDRKMQDFEVNVVAWGRRCRMNDLSPDRIRRTLEKPHEDLIRVGYLRDVEYRGRGAQQTVMYTFAADIEVANPELTSRLTAHRVAPKQAVALIETHGNDVVAARLQQAERILQGGAKFRNPAGFVVSFIRNPDDYLSRQEVLPERTPDRTPAQPRLLGTSGTLDPGVGGEDPDEHEARRWASLGPDERAREVKGTLRAVLGSRLSAREYELLTDAMSVEAVSAHDLRRDVLDAVRDGRADEAAQSLRVIIHTLEQG